MQKKFLSLIPAIIVILSGCSGSSTDPADKIIIGNIITMDELNPVAEAMTVKDGIIQFVGSEKAARKFCNDSTVVMDYGGNYIYPGFLEAHAHGSGAGLRLAGQANLKDGKSIEDYVRITKEWIEAHPDKEVITGSGWEPWSIPEPTAADLDAIAPDKPVALNSVDGHSMWVNTALMKKMGIDKAYAKKMGAAQVHVDAAGDPTGLLTESAATSLMGVSPTTLEDFKDYVLAWQDFAFSNGYTCATEAGVELAGPYSLPAYVELAKEGKLKLRTFAYHLVKDDSATPEEDVAAAVKDASEYNSEYFNIIGMKIFIDGVIEAHTGWMLEDYADEPGYHGLERYHDHDVAVRLIKAASERGLSVHAHTIGDGAVRFAMDAIAEAEEATGNLDQRNILVHLQVVNPEDIKRFAEYKVIAGTAPLWTPLSPAVFKQETNYIGEKKAMASYPVKSFLDAGVVNVSHTDYPVSPVMSIPRTIYMGEMRADPDNPEGTQRNPAECVSRMDILKSLTTNVAYLWHAEDKLGSLEAGKIANATIYDKDFINDPVQEIPDAKLVATIVDGDVVYEGK